MEWGSWSCKWTTSDIRWQSLLYGSRDPICGIAEKIQRVYEAVALLRRTFAKKDLHSCLQALSEHLIMLQFWRALNNHPRHNSMLYSPSKTVLQLLMLIGPMCARLSTFLRAGLFTLFANAVQSLVKTTGQRGHEIDLNEMLGYLLKHAPPKDPNAEVWVKIAFDGGTMTTGKRIQQEQGTVQILTDHSAELKSHTTTHQWIIYLGAEDYEEMQQELEHAAQEIDSQLNY
jgi:hypothetical protein